jgi:hypothetical protein
VYRRWLATTAASYVVLHHLGLLPGGLGDAGDDTQWADWLDLLVPYLVLMSAALTLREARASTRTWSIFGLGAVTYATGHGIHLAANSVGNADPGATAHLWDEVVGHVVWYAGVALVLLALARTMPGRERSGAVGYVLAVAVGLTWASNAIGGGTEVLCVLIALVAVGFGWRHREDLGLTLLVGFLPAVVLLVVSMTPWL